MVQISQAHTRPVPRVNVNKPLVAVSFVIIIAIWAAAIYRAKQDHRNKQVELAMSTANITETFQKSLNDTISQVDLVLKALRDRQGTHAAKTSRDKLIDPSTLANPAVTQIAAVGADGNTIASTIPSERWANLNFKDREHFKAHLDTSRDELFISKPIFGRGSGRVSLQLTRRLSKPDGSFGGIVLASIDPSKLVSSYQSLSLGAAGGIALVDSDGIVLAGAGVFAERQGLTLADPKMAMSKFDGADSNAIKQYVIERHKSSNDSRLVISRKIRDYRLSAAVAVADPTDIGFWEQLNSIYLQFAMLGTVLLVIGTMLVLRYETKAQDEAVQL